MEGLLLLIIVMLVYILPWLVALGREHHQANAIGLLNLLLGWTALGWIIALIWAATHVEQKKS